MGGEGGTGGDDVQIFDVDDAPPAEAPLEAEVAPAAKQGVSSKRKRKARAGRTSRARES